LPKKVERALEIDYKTGTTSWYDAIQKEMKNNSIAFEFCGLADSIPIGYKKIPLHMIFDFCMDFMQKAC
jgi:hypothetical protein